jgi:anti-anti-sigma factor
MQAHRVEGPSKSFTPSADSHGATQVSALAEEGWTHVMVNPFGVTSHDFDGGRLFALRGELDASTCQGLAERLIGLPGSLVVVDLCQLTFIDSSGVGAIHAARQMAISDGGTLVVSRPTPIVHRVLEITGLDVWIVDWDPAWSNGSPVRCAP